MTLAGKSTLAYKSNELATLGIGIRLYWLEFAISYSNSILNFYIDYHINLPKPWQNALKKYRKFPFFDFSKHSG